MGINVRNFSIIAHIDHGKSTLADRMLEVTKTVRQRDMKDQVLDDMDLERERGITIKSHPIRMKYKHSDGNQYTLNLIDTPGHVDFSYEVSRSLAACEGALLLVDAAQGVEAQTVSNAYLAIENDLEIIPVINKIDLKTARIEDTTREVKDLIGCEEDEIIFVSAKEGQGLDDIFEAIIEKVPAPDYEPDKPLRALIFDSNYDPYQGAVPHIRVFEGEVEVGDFIQFFSDKRKLEVSELGYFIMGNQKTKKLTSGDVGYLVCGLKDISRIEVGDTITSWKEPAEQRLPGYKEIKPMVFSGMYPVNPDDYKDLRKALDKMKLNDSSLTFEPENSGALGFGFRCGYLGMLHMEVVQERLEREFEIELITTVPNVKYYAVMKDGEEIEVETPGDMPQAGKIEIMKEPYVKAEIITPDEYVGNIMKLCEAKRGNYVHTHYLDMNKVQIEYELPMMEMIYDFYDKLKSTTRGYASFDYETIGYKEGDLVKVDILVNKDVLDPLSFITHQDDAYYKGRDLCRKLKELIPKHMFKIPIQAAIGNKVIARTNIKALRKNVTAKCYGGDVTRKRKLIEKQKEGKKRMKQVGSVEVPQEAFFAILDTTE
ncbi:MAG: translation elongation factor 4 [Candidatus Marinimicrobia bacterium]|nr:translation elongation factor 4 [Candidatus Neomarinimicrobiota bacterium]